MLEEGNGVEKKGQEILSLNNTGILEKIDNTLKNHGNIVVIGNGEIGDKARELIENESLLMELGFKLPKTIILSEDILCRILQELGIGDNLESVENTQAIDSYSKIPESLVKLGEEIKNYFNGKPIAIRSSGKGDSLGIGIYKSKFLGTEPYDRDFDSKTIAYYILEVLKSYFSDDGKEYRRLKKLGNGFAIIIQEIVGQEIPYEEFQGEVLTGYEPIISGNGYTSTEFEQGPVLSLQAGIGGGVGKEGVGGITEKIIKISKSIFVILEDIRSEITKTSFDTISTSRKGYRFSRLFPKINLQSLFKQMKELERQTGKSYYIEFASKQEDGTLIHYITQISEIKNNSNDKNTDVIDFNKLNNVILKSSDSVVGSGIKKSKKIIYCLKSKHISKLDNFNEENEDYILITSAYMISKGCDVRMSFASYSNAGVVFVEGADNLGGPLESHLRGLAGSLGKFIGGIGGSSEIDEFFEKNEATIIEGNFEVIASERQQQIAVLKK